jgi:phosphopantothenoylcysteine decarboxylase/phosphopantothenate--cysteine ligase
MDILVANDISAPDAGFSVDTNRVTLLFPNAKEEALPLMSKSEVAEIIITHLGELLEN